MAAIGLALGFAGLASLRSWEIVPLRLPPGERLLELEEGEGATVSLTERGSGERRVRTLSLNGRYTLGASSGALVHRSQGELALALHGEPREVAFIGVATGMSASAIRSHPSVRSALALELFPGVIRLAPRLPRET